MNGSRFSERHQTGDQDAIRSDRPKGQIVNCPECGDNAIAVIPKNAILVSREYGIDGSVWVNCHACEDRFRQYFTIQE